MTTEAKKVTVAEATKEALKKIDTMSGKIRYLSGQKMTTGDISRTLTSTEGKEVRYQWVRNVLITPVKNPKK